MLREARCPEGFVYRVEVGFQGLEVFFIQIAIKEQAY